MQIRIPYFTTQRISQPIMQPIPVPAFKDNYIWLAPCGEGDERRVIVVDPGTAAPVLDRLAAQQWEPAAILITHHHYDHVDGVEALRARFSVPVFGPRGTVDRWTGQGGRALDEGDHLDALGLRVLATPGHTRDHLSYVGQGVVFCGDTLFAGGCGRLFEGTPEEMYRSLEKLRALPDDTRICCAHEYTLANLRFARQVEPDNDALARRLEETEAMRREGKPTVPSRLGLEKQTNPFLRCHEPAVHAAAERFCRRRLSSPAQVFAVIRYWKDNFRQ